MQVTITHQIDAGDHFYYEYDLYFFTDGKLTFMVRSYVDEPDHASFLRAEINQKARHLVKNDLTRPLFREAVAYLNQLGKTKIKWLTTSGYISL